MKHMRAAVLLLLVRGSNGRDPRPGLGRIRGSARDRARDNQATFNVPGKTRPSASTLTVGRFQVHPEDQPFATKGTVTLILKCRDLLTAEDAVGQYPEPIVIKANSTVRVVNVPASGADRAFKKLSANCVVTPDQPVYALPYKTAAAQEGRRLEEETPYGIPMVLEDVAWWKSKFDSSPPAGSSKVCVVDTGYGNGHEDLPTLDQDEDGFNPYEAGEWYIDGDDHGTHCAGTIGALGDNSKGVVGVLPNSIDDKFSFFIGKGLQDNGTGSTSAVMAAVQACVDNGSNVISMSLGGAPPSDTVSQLYYSHYKDDDVLIISSAGNYGDSSLSYPASYPSIMSVAAVDSNENKAGFSQYNEQVEIAAPGVGVLSTITSDFGSSFGYASYSGTSMAAPHVAGVAALLRMYFPNCKAFQIRNAMVRTGKDKGDAECDVNYGHGIVQAKAAYEFLEENPCDPDEAFKEPVGGCDEFNCIVDSDCDDGNPDTIDTCQSGSCTTSCTADAGCDDGNPNTIDTCGSNGVCTHECANGDVVVDITTDGFPAETSWQLLQEGVIQGEGGVYFYSNTLHTHHVCAGYGEATFTIFDYAGDGICCDYGQGSYVITHNGVEKASGGEFTISESVSFNIVQVCTVDSDCDDGNPDTINTCQSGSCTTSCATNAGCDDGNPNTIDTCGSDGVCTHECTTGDVVVDITTDDFPGETSWQLLQEGVTLEEGGGYTDSNTLHTHHVCAGYGEATFTIFDDEGDGICCGVGQGSYVITHNGEEKASGGYFAYSESVSFNIAQACTVDSDCDDGNPDTINTCQESGACTTSCATDAGCDDGNPNTIDTCGSDGVCAHECTNADVVIDITTDDFPGETSWELLQEGVTLGEGGGYTDSNTLHTHHVCAGYGEATFTIFDDLGDGICCSAGQGSYLITHNGVEKVSGGYFEYSESVSFNIAQPNPPTIGCSADATASNYHPDPDVEVCCEWDDDDVPAALSQRGPPVLISLHGSPPDSTSDEGYNAWCKAHAEQVLSDVACALSIPSSYVALGRGWLRRCRREWREDGIVVPLTLRRNPWQGAAHACRRLDGQYAAEGSPLWRGNLTKTMRMDGDLPCNIGGSSTSSKSSKSPDGALEMADVGGDEDGNIFPWDDNDDI